MTYFCENCEEEFEVEGRYNAEGDFEPFDDQDIHCSECDSVGELFE